jgi:hypothetical protein
MSEEKKEKINVSIDTKRTEELVRENEKLKQQLRNIGEKDLNKDDNDLLEHKVQAFKKFNDPHVLDCQTQEELSNYVTNLINEALKHQKGTPTGSAPMNDSQLGKSTESLFNRKFGSEKEMVESIIDQMNNGATQELRDEAKSYYAALLKKWIQTRKREPNAPEGFFNPNLPENLPLLKEEHGFKVPENPEEGDIGKLLKKWREERKQKGFMGQKGQGA